MCVLAIGETLPLYYIGKKCQGSQWEAFLCFESQGDYYHKTALNWVKMKVFAYGV